MVGAGVGGALLGRERELARVRALLEQAAAASAAMVLLGEPGIGKTALLGAAIERAQRSGYRVLQAAGTGAESKLAFAGLHQLLRPALSGIDTLPLRQAAALRCAFGLGDEAPPDRFLIGLATLTLLAELSDDQPLLVAIDDVPWFDRGSLEALAFAVRRLHAERIAVLLASRSEPAVAPFGGGVPRLTLAPLNNAAANALLDQRADVPHGRIREQIVAEAAGNPLALIELGAAPAQTPSTSAALRPGERLERIFAERLAELPVPTRKLLTLAAAGEADELAAVVRAAEAIGLSPRDLQPAEDAGLIALDRDALQFRHPLMRAAVYHAASSAGRRAAHLALANALESDADRRAWHLAAMASTPDEAVAQALEASADRFRARAGYAAAARALERAAELSPEPSQHTRRLAIATEMAFVAGRAAWVDELATRLLTLTDDPRLRARAAVAMAQVHALSGRVRVEDALNSAGVEGVVASAPDIGVLMLVVAAGYAYLMGDRELGATAERLVRALPGSGQEPWRLYVLAATDPAGAGATLEPQLSTCLEDAPADPRLLIMVSTAAWFIDRPVLANALLARSVDDMRTRGDFGALGPSLAILGLTHVWRGRWSDARALAAETVQVATDTAQPLIVGFGHAVAALALALQGDAEAARDQAATALAHARGGLVAALGTWAMGVAALGAGRSAPALEHLQKVRALHMEVGRWAAADLVEASVLTGDRGLVDGAARDAECGASSRAVVVARRACALLAAEDGAADALFQSAIATNGASDWPFELARARLSYGEWLRRRRRIVAARPVLRSALDGFSELGAHVWADRARGELRAAGVTLEPRASRAVDELTPQQRQIAQLAARGLTNREIGAQLFLSPRTVGFHLYNVFPKLGVTTRAQLAQVLGEAQSPLG